VTRSGPLPLSANGRAFLFCCLECPCIPNGRAGKGKARPAAWRGRDNRVEGVNLGGNRAPARGRNRNSGPEPTPTAALAGFLGPARMAGGSTGFGNCQGWGEQASACRSPALPIAQSETGARRDHIFSMADLSVVFVNLSNKLNAGVLISPSGIIKILALLRASKLIPSQAGILRQCAGSTIEVGCMSVGRLG